MLLVIAFAGAAARPPKPDLTLRPVPTALRTSELCFGSGLRVLAQESRDRPLVTVSTVHTGGKSDDPPGREGTAHLAEHLWYRSDADGLDVERRLEALGATWNGFTTERQAPRTSATPAPDHVTPGPT